MLTYSMMQFRDTRYFPQIYNKCNKKNSEYMNEIQKFLDNGKERKVFDASDGFE